MKVCVETTEYALHRMIAYARRRRTHLQATYDKGDKDLDNIIVLLADMLVEVNNIDEARKVLLRKDVT